MEEKKKYNIGGIVRRSIFSKEPLVDKVEVMEEFTQTDSEEPVFYKAKVAVHVRKEPSISSGITNVLLKGEITTGNEEEDSEWVSTTKGFVMKKFLKKVK